MNDGVQMHQVCDKLEFCLQEARFNRVFLAKLQVDDMG